MISILMQVRPSSHVESYHFVAMSPSSQVDSCFVPGGNHGAAAVVDLGLPGIGESSFLLSECTPFMYPVDIFSPMDLMVLFDEERT